MKNHNTDNLSEKITSAKVRDPDRIRHESFRRLGIQHSILSLIETQCRDVMINFVSGRRKLFSYCILTSKETFEFSNIILFILIFFRLIPIGLFLNGCAYAMTAVGATVLSETWFPPSQRATATVIYIISAAAGGALVFIVGKSQNSLIKQLRADFFISIYNLALHSEFLLVIM